MPERIILRAFAGKRELYRASFDGSTLRGYRHEDPDNFVPGGGADVDQIDRFLFFDSRMSAPEDVRPLCAIRVLSGEMDHLEVTNPGQPGSRLTLQGKFRSWLDDLEPALEFRFILAPDHDRIAFEWFEVSRIERAPTPIVLSAEGLLASQKPLLIHSQPQTVQSAYRMPPIAITLNLMSGPPLGAEYELKYDLGFLRQDSNLGIVGGKTPQLLMVLRKEVSVGPSSIVLPGVNLKIDSTLLRQIKPSGPWQKKSYQRLVQRQPTGFDPLEAVDDHWIFAVDVPQGEALVRFNERVTSPLLEALHRVQDGQPLSFLPQLTSSQPGPLFWSASYDVVDRDHRRDVPAWPTKILKPNDNVPQTGVGIFAKRLTSNPEGPSGALELSATLDGVKTVGLGGSLKFGCGALPAVANVPLEAELGSPPAFCFMLQYRVPPRPAPHDPPPPAPIADAQLVKMGALDLQFPPLARKPIDPPPGPSDETWTPEATTVWATFDPDTNDVITRDVGFAVPVNAIRPGGQDDLPGDEYLSDLGLGVDSDAAYARQFAREPALVFSTNEPSPSLKAPFALYVRERNAPGASHSLQLRLLRTEVSPDQGDVEAYVFDSEPFLFARVRAEDYEKGLAQGITAEIGNWTNRADVRGWELAAGASGFYLDLPPQGVGEAMHKRIDVGDIEPGQPVDFRFTPAAELTLRPSYSLQRFAEAPWNLRRILGYPGERAPGAQIDRARFELFYGLFATLEPRNLRLAEIGARLGQLAGAQRSALPWPATPEEMARYTEHRHSWANLQQTARSRIGILEPWRESNPDDAILGEDDKLSIHLRESAVLRYPIAGVDPGPGHDEFGAVGDPIPGPERLAGGWAWGFESHNILQAVLRERDSSAAQISRLFFSSLGGWGHQKASFDGGRTTIYCDVSMGRVASVNIERLGRIEPFWNRAKHVIVYERTVVASRQFYLEQEPFLGAPILRKVSEYVELLQDERPFPDFDTPAENRGFVLACRFAGGKPARIPVNSLWGGDVGNIGWAVPLWQRNAAPSDVYPRPDVRLILAGVREGETTPAGIDDVEKIHFFTSTEANTGSDPDRWVPVAGLSYEALYEDQLKPPDPGSSDGDPKSFAAAAGADPQTKVGAGRFTFNFLSPSGPANIVMDRSAERIGARVHNATVMRGAAIVHELIAKPVVEENTPTEFRARISIKQEEQPQAVPIRDWVLQFKLHRRILTVTNARLAGQAQAGDRCVIVPLTGSAGIPIKDPFEVVIQCEPGTLLDEPSDCNVRSGMGQLDSLRDDLANALVPLSEQVTFESTPIGDEPLRQLLADVRGELVRFHDEKLGSIKNILDEPSDALCNELSRRLASRFDLMTSSLRDDMESATVGLARQFRIRMDVIRAEIEDLNLAKERLVDELTELTIGDGGAVDRIRFARGNVGEIVPNIERAMQSITEAARLAVGALRTAHCEVCGQSAWPPPPVELESLLDTVRESVLESLRQMDFAIGETARHWIGGQLDAVRCLVAPQLLAVEHELRILRLLPLRQSDPNQLKTEIEAAIERTSKQVRDLETSIVTAIGSRWQAVIESLLKQTALAAPVRMLARKLRDAVNDQGFDTWDKLFKEVEDSVGDFLGGAVGLKSVLSSALATARNDLTTQATSLCQALAADLLPTIQQVFSYLEQLLDPTLLDDFEHAAELSQAFLRREIERLHGAALSGLAQLRGRAQLSLPTLPSIPLQGVVDATLRLLRAFGHPPKLPNLSFSLDRCGYYPFEFKVGRLPQLFPHIQLTPLVAGANELFRDLINPVNIHLPVRGILDRLVPPDLGSFDLNKTFQDWGGMRLKSLFPNLKLPSIATDNVRVTHGVEPSTKTGWLQVDADVPFGDEPQTIFALAGITLRLRGARFEGHSRTEATVGQPPRQTIHGSILGDWDLQVGGFPIAVLDRCGLRFEDGGRMEFDISPDRVKLQAALEFLADLMSQLGYSDSGFSFAVTDRGARTTLSLPLPDVQAGAFGLSNLNLGFWFEIGFLRGPFNLTTGLRVGRRIAPFNLTIFILGGAGWFETEVSYTPATGDFDARVSVALFASASLAIALGPVRGGVSAFFGIAADFIASNHGGGSLSIAIVIIFRGEVCLLGFISVGLCLTLEAQYRSGGQLVGRGRIEFRIKIGWFLTINVSHQVEFAFGGANGNRAVSTAARQHVDMFG